MLVAHTLLTLADSPAKLIARLKLPHTPAAVAVASAAASVPAPTRPAIALDDLHTDASWPLRPSRVDALRSVDRRTRAITVTLVPPVLGLFVDSTWLSESRPSWLIDRLKLARDSPSHVLAAAINPPKPAPVLPATLLVDHHVVILCALLPALAIGLRSAPLSCSATSVTVTDPVLGWLTRTAPLSVIDVTAKLNTSLRLDLARPAVAASPHRSRKPCPSLPSTLVLDIHTEPSAPLRPVLCTGLMSTMLCALSSTVTLTEPVDGPFCTTPRVAESAKMQKLMLWLLLSRPTQALLMSGSSIVSPTLALARTLLADLHSVPAPDVTPALVHPLTSSRHSRDSTTVTLMAPVAATLPLTTLLAAWSPAT